MLFFGDVLFPTFKVVESFERRGKFRMSWSAKKIRRGLPSGVSIRRRDGVQASSHSRHLFRKSRLQELQLAIPTTTVSFVSNTNAESKHAN
jgi:hypothetical protein